MKKIYMAPNTRVVIINSVSFVAQSNFGKGTGDFNSSTMKYSRQDNSWDIWGGGDDEE